MLVFELYKDNLTIPTTITLKVALNVIPSRNGEGPSNVKHRNDEVHVGY